MVNHVLRGTSTNVLFVRCLRIIVTAHAVLTLTSVARAQTVYHLHKEISGLSAAWQLKTGGPDAAAVAFQSPDFKNFYVNTVMALKNFETQTGVPNAAGRIPSGSVVSVSFWMKKTANWGALVPQVSIWVNAANGTDLCAVTGTAALTTTLTKYTLTCATVADVVLGTTDRFYAVVEAKLTATAGNHSVKAELDVEGTLNGNYDSTITIPAISPAAPIITNLSPVIGPTGTSVTVAGQYFGATQGSSTLKFNGLTASPTSWSSTSIVASVPSTASTGPVLITVGGQASNVRTFTVTSTGTIAGTVTRASDASFVSGATVDILQAGLLKGTATTNGSGQYTTVTLASGSYDVRVSAPGLVTQLRTAIGVGGGTATTVNVALPAAATITGHVTQSGGSPVIGAAVSASAEGSMVSGSVTDGNGLYLLPVTAGTYSVEASAPGFAPAVQANNTVADGGTITVDLSLNSVAPTTISYVYDELGRLVGVIDATGDTATYRYDAVGNVLSIGRQSSSAVSIIEFTPNSGSVGTVVTIYGTGFSTVPSENTVTFNGVAGTVTGAVSTQLTVSVPSGASSGPISVTTPGGSALSATSFVLVP